VEREVLSSSARAGLSLATPLTHPTILVSGKYHYQSKKHSNWFYWKWSYLYQNCKFFKNDFCMSIQHFTG